MNRYVIEKRVEQGEQIVLLRDEEERMWAEVIPGIGAQCQRFVWEHDCTTYDLLHAAPSVASLREQPGRYGIPVLFPFPNRVAGGRFTFAGKEARLPINEPERGNSLHGLVFDKPWTVQDMGADAHSAWVTCVFTTQLAPTLLHHFPFPFALEYGLSLKEGRLETHFAVTNVGDSEMPVGFGLHPWFPLPITASGNRATCRLQAPVSQLWELKNLLPTGRIVPAEPGRDLRSDICLADEIFDDVYTGVETDGWWRATYTDPVAGIEIAVVSDDSLRELVVYAPADQAVICVEPYSCTTNAVNLEDQGISAGLVALPPGNTWTARIHFVPRATERRDSPKGS